MAFTTSAPRPAARKTDRKERHRVNVAAAAARGRDLAGIIEDDVQAGRNGLPRPKNPKRKAFAAESIENFAKTYLPRVFSLPMSDGQRSDLATMQACITNGGRYAFAAPRGDGKTSRVEAAILWAALFNHRKCVVIVGADLGAAQDIQESIKSELRTNELLREDFPLPCHAAAASDDTALKAKGFTWNGASLAMKWSKSMIVLPVMDGADGSGCVIVPRGLTGRLRGMRIKVGKKAVRPDLFAIDDPQTDESAGSPSQVETREKLILGAIMGSGGPSESTAAFMPCTVICNDDLAARFLDRKRRPDWQGSARGLVQKWPNARESLWEHYFSLRRETSEDAATRFYRENRAKMDEGAAVDWPARFIAGKELSPIQHAMNLLCDLGEQVFFAEYQNEPKKSEGALLDLPLEHVARRTNGLQRRTAPENAAQLFGFADINADGMRWALAVASNQRALSIVEYGVFPGNGAPLIHDGETEALGVMRGLSGLDQILRGMAVMRGNDRLPLDLFLVDCGGPWMQAVFDWLGTTGRASPVPWFASRGAGSRNYRPGRNIIGRPGDGWHVARWPGKGVVLVHDSDRWRHRQQKGWFLPPAAPDSISLHGTEGTRHDMFAAGVCAEKLIAYVETPAGPLYKWSVAPGSRNDFGDVATGLFIAASRLGLTPAGRIRPVSNQVRRRPRISWVTR